MSDWVTKSQINRSASSFLVFSPFILLLLFWTTSVDYTLTKIILSNYEQGDWIGENSKETTIILLFQTVSDIGFRQSHWLVGAMSKVGFWLMFANLHDNISNTRDTNQAVNGSLSIFLSLPWINDATIWASFVAFFHCMCNRCTFFKTKQWHPGKGAIWSLLVRKACKNYLIQCVVSGLSSLKNIL